MCVGLIVIKANYKPENYFKWVSDSGYLAQETALRRMNAACQLLLGNLCCKGWAMLFALKKSPKLLNFTFLPSLPAQIPAPAQQTQWDFGQERAGFSLKAPVLQFHIYHQKRPVGHPCAGFLLGNSQEELENSCWSFLKVEHKFSLLLVDGFIICSHIRAFFVQKAGAPTNSSILCMFPSMLG